MPKAAGMPWLLLICDDLKITSYDVKRRLWHVEWKDQRYNLTCRIEAGHTQDTVLLKYLWEFHRRAMHGQRELGLQMIWAENRKIEQDEDVKSWRLS